MTDRQDIKNDLEEAIRSALSGNQANLWTALPGEITSVDFAKATCSVQPTIQAKVIQEDGTSVFVNLPVLVDVPIHFVSGGGFLITVPISIGDEVLVVFSSRCIDAWWQSGGIQKPAELRMHDLSDGFAIPGVFSQPNVPDDISDDELQIRNTEGDTYISVTDDGKIKLVAPGGVEITGDVEVTGDVVADGISLKTHIHSGVDPGAGNSGPPV